VLDPCLPYSDVFLGAFFLEITLRFFSTTSASGIDSSLTTSLSASFLASASASSFFTISAAFNTD